MSARMTAPEQGIKVRMYRQGLGDCFLLAWQGEDGSPKYMLIDCGTVVGAEPLIPLAKVMEDILESTAGQVDYLVATHEHWDHLSGFQGEPFKRLEVGEVWMAWTEDPKDPLARELHRQRRQALKALQKAAEQLEAAGEGDDNPFARRVRSVLEFFGGFGASELGARATTKSLLEAVREKVEKPRYHRPGEVLELGGGLQAYVLGPPTERQLLKKANPSSGAKSEVYHLYGAASDELAFYSAVQVLSGEADFSDPYLPFDAHYSIPASQAKVHPYFIKRYGFTQGHPSRWRSIDLDWLGAAGPLALKLDNATNNTSLAMALELPGSGKVLLFPGDAQVGSWLSWGSLEFETRDPQGQPRTVNTDELLARTALYKVSHHASHNGTLKALGLEKMVSDELTAFIPVDEQTARENKDWDMPFGPLLEALEKKTSGRIFRADRGVGLREKTKRPEGFTAAGWKQFKQNARQTEMFVEYVVQ